MIEYLEQLVEEKKYREALKEAERLLPILDDPRHSLATYVSVVISQCCLGQWREALVSGSVAVRLAEELADWDAYGMVSLYVGNAYSRLGQYDEAIRYMYEFLAHINRYETSSDHEAVAWFNLGTWLLLLRRPEEAIKCLWNALAAAERSGNRRYAHGISQALIDAHLQVGLLEPIPRLLAKCGHYLRKNPHTEITSRIFHFQLRSQYAVRTNRFRRAVFLAVRGLQLASGMRHEFWFHLLLSRMAQKREDVPSAISHALAARHCAVREDRPDFEIEANNLIRELSNTNVGDNEGLDRYSLFV